MINFIAPSSLDYSPYCTTRNRDGIEADSLASAMACLQEAVEWHNTGNFEVVTSKMLIKNETDGFRVLEKGRISLKFTIHRYCFAIIELSKVGYVVACGYTKEGVICCSPSDEALGNHGKFILPWAQYDAHFVCGWSGV